MGWRWRAFCSLVMIGWVCGCSLTLETIRYRDAVRSDAVHPDADRRETDARSADGFFQSDGTDDRAVAQEDALSEDLLPEDGSDGSTDAFAADRSADASDASDVFSDATFADLAEAGDVPADVPVDAPPPPPVLIQFQHSGDVMRFSDYWVRWQIPGTAISGWTSGHCVSGAPRPLPIPDNWTECELDVRLPLGTALDFYAIFGSGAEVCGSGTGCPINYLYRYVVIQGARRYMGSSDLSFQRETVGVRVYQFIRVYL